MGYKKMTAATRAGNRLDELKTLADILACSIDSCGDMKTLPQLARQYRETVREIEEIEGVDTSDDDIGKILSGRASDGKPGAVRKDRSGV